MDSNTLTLAGRWDHWKDRLQQVFAGESRRQLMISVSSLAGGGLISVALRFVGSIIQGRFIGPEMLGYYNKFTILPGYMFFLHMGVYTSLARQYPYYLARGEKAIALKFAAGGLGWTHFLCIIHALVFLVPCVFASMNGQWSAALGWGTQIIVTSTSLYMFYLGSTYRNSSEFVAWSKASVISAIASLLFLPFVALYHFIGLCARSSLPNFISMLYAHWKRPLRIRARFDFGILKKMIAFGAPLMVFAYISTSLWEAVERSYILKMTDEKTLGVFVFAVTLCIGLTTVATSISQVFNPRLAMLYGSSGNSMETCFRYCIKCSIAGVVVMLPLIALTYWLVGPFIEYFLPKYVESITIVRCLCWMSLIPVIDLPKQLLINAKRTRLFAVSVLIGFGLYLSLLGMFAFGNAGVTLQKTVIASVSCRIFMSLISTAISWRESRPNSHVPVNTAGGA